jgi:hypothetical protein
MGKKMERQKRKGKPFATMKRPYLWVKFLFFAFIKAPPTTLLFFSTFQGN